MTFKDQSFHFPYTLMGLAHLKSRNMDLTLRYWSPTHEKVWTVFYTSLFFGHATADIVSKNMYHKMCEDGIPVDRIFTLVRDGRNVNKAIFRKMNELILQDFPDYWLLFNSRDSQCFWKGFGALWKRC